MSKKDELIMPGYWMIKDKNSIFKKCSYELARSLGWDTAEDTIGKTDYDVRNETVKFADKYVKDDSELIKTGNKLNLLEVHNISNEWTLLLVEKVLCDCGSGIKDGVLVNCINVTNVPIFRKVFTPLDKDKFIDKAGSYLLTKEYSPIKLTKMQEICLFLLVRGKSAKEIAKILGNSYRTVETHFEILKNKLY